MIGMSDAFTLIDKQRGDAVVIPTMTARGAWANVSTKEGMDLPITGAMGKASSVALGITLADPDRKVIVLDGDGSLLMNLGTLVTVAGQMPENLYHFVVNNEVYGVTGGQPVPNANGYNFEGIAESSGYAASYEFDNLEDFATSLDEIFSAKGPVMINLKTVPEIETTPLQLRPRASERRTPQAIQELRETLG